MSEPNFLSVIDDVTVASRMVKNPRTNKMGKQVYPTLKSDTKSNLRVQLGTKEHPCRVRTVAKKFMAGSNTFGMIIEVPSNAEDAMNKFVEKMVDGMVAERIEGDYPHTREMIEAKLGSIIRNKRPDHPEDGLAINVSMAEETEPSRLVRVFELKKRDDGSEFLLKLRNPLEVLQSKRIVGARAIIKYGHAVFRNHEGRWNTTRYLNDIYVLAFGSGGSGSGDASTTIDGIKMDVEEEEEEEEESKTATGDADANATTTTDDVTHISSFYATGDDEAFLDDEDGSDDASPAKRRRQ